MITIRYRENEGRTARGSFADGRRSRQRHGTIVRGICSEERYPKFLEEDPREVESNSLFIREVMPTLHVRAAVSGTVRRAHHGAIPVPGKSQTAWRGKLPEYKINARRGVLRTNQRNRRKGRARARAKKNAANVQSERQNFVFPSSEISQRVGVPPQLKDDKNNVIKTRARSAIRDFSRIKTG